MFTYFTTGPEAPSSLFVFHFEIDDDALDWHGLIGNVNDGAAGGHTPNVNFTYNRPGGIRTPFPEL